MSTYIIMGEKIPLKEEFDLDIAKEILQEMPNARTVWEVSTTEDLDDKKPILIASKTATIRISGVKEGEKIFIWSCLAGSAPESGLVEDVSDSREGQVLAGKSVDIRVRSCKYKFVSLNNMLVKENETVLVQLYPDL